DPITSDGRFRRIFPERSHHETVAYKAPRSTEAFGYSMENSGTRLPFIVDSCRHLPGESLTGHSRLQRRTALKKCYFGDYRFSEDLDFCYAQGITGYFILVKSGFYGTVSLLQTLALNCAIEAADTMLGSLLHKARLWQRINTKQVTELQRKVINRILEHDWQGQLNTSKYAKLAKDSTDTALCDIRELLERGIIVKNEGDGRSTSYRLASRMMCEGPTSLRV
ncbi:MAG: hypothetical protein ABIK28_17965, partial [Planctomycetota bacterium]